MYDGWDETTEPPPGLEFLSGWFLRRYSGTICELSRSRFCSGLLLCASDGGWLAGIAGLARIPLHPYIYMTESVLSLLSGNI